MKRIHHYLLPILFALIQFSTIPQAHSQGIQFAEGIQLNPLFSDHMVLQRNMAIPIWGKAERAGMITVTINGSSSQTMVDSNGAWKVELPPMKAGGPYILKVISSGITTISDVYIGDVWICSGQSNMEWPLSKVQDAEQEKSKANYPLIRLITIEQALASKKQSSGSTSGWKITSPESATSFSAVGYFFGRELHSTQNIPIGLIQSTWDGTAIQSWMSAEALTNFPEYQEIIQRLGSQNLYYRDITAINNNWKAALPGKDMGLHNLPWHTPRLNDQDWNALILPQHWERTGESALLVYDGVVWFRRNFLLPQSWANSETTLSLGPIDDEDSTWINGHLVGSGQMWDKPRRYPIPESILHTGKNQLTVRVLDYASLGGLWASNKKDLHLENSKGATIPLAGKWKYKIGIPAEQMPPHADINTPSMIYNAMIHPLISFGIRGIIWYQGEANTWEPFRYRSLFPAMIKNWRKQWQQEELPFYYVQLANYLAPHPVPHDNDWAELREAQLMALTIPNTGMAVTIDIGDSNSIHPANKQDVGKRLALIARNNIYGDKISYSGPVYSSMKIEEDKIRIFFNHAEKGLQTTHDEKVKGFAISGHDKKFIWANARIDGKTVVVSHPLIKRPKAVRYAWDTNPTCNLYNKDNLPASPFRTDNFPGTDHRR
ncbi:MAG: hypothetical protein JKY62_14390 [Desulfocapsa sp.]|nr:hypothetical protein [Desulfocapsa sp.]